MYAAKVIGTVVATQKDPRMNGLKMQVVQPVNLVTFKEEGKPAVAIDAVGAGDGEVVLVVAGVGFWLSGEYCGMHAQYIRGLWFVARRRCNPQFRRLGYLLDPVAVLRRLVLRILLLGFFFPLNSSVFDLLVVHRRLRHLLICEVYEFSGFFVLSSKVDTFCSRPHIVMHDFTRNIRSVKSKV